MTDRKAYTKKFKLGAVRLLEDGEVKGSDLARQLCIGRNFLYKWQVELKDKD